MRNAPTRMHQPPAPTISDPNAQVKWIFFQLEAEYDGHSAARIRYATAKYLSYIAETGAFYPELKENRRFYLSEYWESDALIRFTNWLSKQKIRSKTRYNIYKIVRQVMTMAYALRVIDVVVYHAPVFKGAPETKQRAAYSEDEQNVINAEIARWIDLANSVLTGYSSIGGAIPPRTSRYELPLLCINGKRYTASEAAHGFGIPYEKISTRIRSGWTHEEAVGLVPRRRFDSGKPIEITVEGITYRSLKSAEDAYGVPTATISHRMRLGWAPEQCVGISPRHLSQKDERALLWMYENQFACDSAAMYEHIYNLGLTRRQHLCTLGRLESLFIRWGVWPYVDYRIVMPLAAELSMLTGLNVEALKELEVDSYEREHKLTGQPAIVYKKRRAASGTRPNERELHLPLLEVGELFLEDSVVERVEKVLGLVLALTARIRDDAPPEIARRLFIMENPKRSRKEGRCVIVPIDPKGYSMNWYHKFSSENALKALFGENFSFNLSRCRPTLATNMVLAGATLFQVQVALGHAHIQTTATYLDSQRLRPVFNETVSAALERIAARSRKFLNEEENARSATPELTTPSDSFHETLSGCGCCDPYNPSENVRKATKHVKGTVCRYWNMCLRCDSAVITENSLPKLVLYRRRVKTALDTDSLSIRSRRPLYEDVVKLIDEILKDDVIFPAATITSAQAMASTMDDTLVDHLIHQGF